jgi:very-long-chain enoyl-CoA reductase
MIDLLPPMFSGRAGKVITLLQLIVAATSYSNETNADTRAQYSKFSKANSTEKSSETKKIATPTWPSKLAMIVIYTPAMITSISLLLLGSYVEKSSHLMFLQNMNIPSPSMAAYLCAIHFLKRVAEVLFLHKYSGRTERGVPIMISVYYTLVSVLVAFGGMNTPDDASVFDAYAEDRTRILVGISVFALGVLGNFYHHYLLAQLRTQKMKTENKYVAPKGGLFSFVAAPHYLFELVGWAGIAIVSHHLNVYLLMAGMTSYLAGRSVAQNDFNRSRFNEKEWPRDRKNLLPFIF